MSLIFCIIMKYHQVNPSHDIINVVQNLITELPYHISNPDTLNYFEKFSIATIGDKKQQKGSDARLFAVKLALFPHLKFMKKISGNIYDICKSLLEIKSIWYSPYVDCTIYASNSESFPRQLSAYQRLNDCKKILKFPF